MRYLKTFFWIVAFYFAIDFSMQNREDVTLRYSFQNIQWFEIPQIPLFLVVLVSIFLGVLLGGLGDLFKGFLLKKTLRQNQKTIERLEKEIHVLRGSGLPPIPLSNKEDGPKNRDLQPLK